MRTVGPLVKVTTFVVVTGLIGTALMLFLGDYSSRPTQQYHARFADVSGLIAGSDVRAAGVSVGQVGDVSVQDDGTVLVSFTLSNEVAATTASTATVRYKNLTGDRYLSLEQGSPASAARLRPGQTIPITQTAPALDLDALYGGFQPLLQALNPQQVNQLSSELISVLQGEGGTIQDLLVDVGSLTHTLADRDAVIGRVVDNLNTVLGTVDDHGKQFGQLIDQLQRLVSGLAADRQTIGGSLSQISELTGSTANLLENIRPDVHGTVSQLGRLAVLLNNDNNKALINSDLQRYPDAYQRLYGAGSYGSFFNFFMCGLRVRFTGPDGHAMLTPWMYSSAPRCQS